MIVAQWTPATGAQWGIDAWDGRTRVPEVPPRAVRPAAVAPGVRQ
jgi:hypothetical protein